MEYPKRIDQLMSTLQVNQTGLAKMMGVSRGIISEFTSGAREPSKDFLFGLSKLRVSLDWFLSGEGPMFRSLKADLEPGLVRDGKSETVSYLPNQQAPDAVREALRPYPALALEGARSDQLPKRNLERRGVPYYDVEASAHIAEVLDGGDHQPEFYVDFEPFNDCDAYLTVYGDSMYPAIQSGEVIAVKQVKTLEVLLWGEKYLVITNEDANNLRTVKLVHQHEDNSKIILRASNPNFKGDTVVLKESIVKMFLVKGKISRGHI